MRNGTRGTVVEIDRASRALHVRTDEGVAVRLPAEYLGDVHHGYALTGHISQGATVERTYLLATPDRGGREWAYVAATRQRVDLALFVVHHEPERLEAALSQSWGRSDAKHLALDLAEVGNCSEAVSAARVDLEGLLLERLMTRVDVLRAFRDDARAIARGARSEEAASARQAAQQIGIQLASLESASIRWSALGEIARPSSRTISVFGPRPADPDVLRAWDRAVATVVTYRGAHSIAPNEPSLLLGLMSRRVVGFPGAGSH